MNKKLYVGNLSSTTAEDELRKLFEQYGAVGRVGLITDRKASFSNDGGNMRQDANTATGEVLRPMPGSALLVTCSRCRTLHRPEDELAFNPICEACRSNGANGARAIPDSHLLSDRAIGDAVSQMSPGLYLVPIPVGIGTAYTHFAFCYAPSAIAAFERDFRDYHELGGSDGLDHQSHPQPSPGSPRACPVHGSLE